MHLSPLQSRLAASFAATCLLLLLYLYLFPPTFAFAAELKEALPIIFDDVDFSTNEAARGLEDPIYEPEFASFERSILGRAPADITALTDNEPIPMNVVNGTTQWFVFVLPGTVSGRETEGRRLELRDLHDATPERSAGAGVTEHQEAGKHRVEMRQDQKKVYISANTCEQPQPIDPSETKADPPQLVLYVSTSPDNDRPGPLADGKTQDMVPFREGAVTYSLDTNKEVYIGIHSPNVSAAFSGIHNFRVAASTADYYFNYNENDDADLIWVDSDSQGALLITHNLTDRADPVLEQQVMITEPYVLFAHNKKDRAINGLKYSFCGLQNYAQIAATKDGRRANMVRTSMTKRGLGNLPKQQFFFSGLNSSAEYIGILALDGSSPSKRQNSANKGTRVFEATSFETKSDHGNCALIFDLTFCDQVAYSVPSNPKFGNSSQLAHFYDAYAANIYANFNKSLSQIACEAPSAQRYSLARNCTDCASAYKDWLCSVTIPRCDDFSSTETYLQPRAISQPFPDGEVIDPSKIGVLSMKNTTSYNSSRNPLIDEVVKPGPYKELLPWVDV
ncbi:hypothetical protein N0V88_001351 [Collariella sp. IMI 366227]|nr:hypothetical protein N0V88_001351 [Collariella sp. IMI 366227]